LLSGIPGTPRFPTKYHWCAFNAFAAVVAGLSTDTTPTQTRCRAREVLAAFLAVERSYEAELHAAAATRAMVAGIRPVRVVLMVRVMQR
jgi:hypothetical protein